LKVNFALHATCIARQQAGFARQRVECAMSKTGIASLTDGFARNEFSFVRLNPDLLF